ncbi:hypothetical protein [Pseudogracilibacillus sp. SO30301A]|uniref:hypothetical protein n=1 Tax=Pseudogracilibacillus sp. SO30301A TaxID=3098291 RepID=UPI00300E2C3A
MNVYERLKELEITLSTHPNLLLSMSRVDFEVMYSIHLDKIAESMGCLLMKTKFGKDLSIGEGYKAARLTMINCLAVIQRENGDLN